MQYAAFIHANQIVTGEGFADKDGIKPSDSDLGMLSDGAVVYTFKKSVQNTKVPDKIVWVGKTADLPGKLIQKISAKNITNLRSKKTIIPGLIDCHNHLIFSGNRASEFAQRCSGVTYSEIAAKGGGINHTVASTRAATIKELIRLGSQRVKILKKFGIKTVEVKSGYGLTLESEVRILEVVKMLQFKYPEITFVPTYMGAHAIPTHLTKTQYVQEIIEKHLPTIAQKKLATFFDVFIDEGYFTPGDAQRLFKAAKSFGLKLKVHADELVNTGATELGVKFGAVSCDHLLKISQKGIRSLSKSNTVGVLLPGTAFYLKEQHAPARNLIQAGVRVALATDFNPGTCNTLSLPTIMTIAALYLKMTRSEILCAVTYNAAKALGLEKNKGTIEIGKDADFTVLPYKNFEELYYKFAWFGL